MSSIVARSSPSFGSTRSAKDFRWISIRCGSSTGFLRREKLLRVTGAALVPANWATPQSIRRAVRPRKDRTAGLTGTRTAHGSARQPLGQGLLTRPVGARAGILLPISAIWVIRSRLLDLGGSAGLLDLLEQVLRLLALDPLLDRLRRLVDQCLGLLEAETGGRADDLDHSDLLVAGAGQHQVDGASLLLRGGAITARRAHGGRRGGDRGR